MPKGSGIGEREEGARPARSGENREPLATTAIEPACQKKLVRSNCPRASKGCHYLARASVSQRHLVKPVSKNRRKPERVSKIQ